jgi:regulatory protein
MFDSEDDCVDLGDGTVTSVTPVPRKPGQYTIAIDGRAAFTITEEAFVRFDIQIGDQLSAERAAEIIAADETARAIQAALVFLAHRPRSEREVRDRLRRGGYSSESIDAAIARLHDWRYLDDADFARRWVENRAMHRPRGRRLLQQELRQKGVDQETVREVIADADLDELAAAEKVARHRLAATSGEDPAAVRRRVSAYLARRGYSYDVVRSALERAMGPPEEMDDALS